MSKLTKTVLRLLPTTIIGLLVNRVIIRRYDAEFIVLDNLIMMIVVLSFAVAFITTLLKDTKDYLQNKLKLSFIPTIIGIIFIISFFVTNVVAAARDKSPVLIFAGYEYDLEGAWFEFRKDGTYKFAKIHGLLGATYSRGNYVLKDSLITLDADKIDNVIQSNLPIINTTEHTISQISHQHNVIDKSTEFTISIDKRK